MSEQELSLVGAGDWHPSWNPLFEQESARPYFSELLSRVEQERAEGKTVYPAAENVFRAFQITPLDSVRVVILGQDPYHQPGQAHGLSFSVQPGVKTPPSLKNIYKAIANDYPGFEPPDHGFLESWARQGVLLLNAVLTVRDSEASAHGNYGWQNFTRAALEFVNTANPSVFLLWGKFAQNTAQGMDESRHLLLKSVHPSPLSAHRGFLTCGHFRKANEWLKENGRHPVNWQLPPE